MVFFRVADVEFSLSTDSTHWSPHSRSWPRGRRPAHSARGGPEGPLGASDRPEGRLVSPSFGVVPCSGPRVLRMSERVLVIGGGVGLRTRRSPRPSLLFGRPRPLIRMVVPGVTPSGMLTRMSPSGVGTLIFPPRIASPMVRVRGGQGGRRRPCRGGGPRYGWRAEDRQSGRRSDPRPPSPEAGWSDPTGRRQEYRPSVAPHSSYVPFLHRCCIPSGSEIPPRNKRRTGSERRRPSSGPFLHSAARVLADTAAAATVSAWRGAPDHNHLFSP